MNEALQALKIKVENGGATPQGKFFAKDWNTLVEAVKQLDLAEFDEAALNKYLKDNGYITSDDIPSTDLSDLVTLSGEQIVTGPKNFTGGIKVNGQPLIYNAELGVWELTGDLLVTGNVAWFASIKGFKPSTIMDAIQVDGESIVINEFGQLKAIGGGSGGSGGGLTVSDLSNYLTTNKYTKQSDVETLISTALTPYALTAAIPTNNNQLSNGAGYITASALDDYATQSWVEGKKYITGITSSQVTTALGFTPYDSANPDKYIKGITYDMVIAALGYTPYSTTNPMGYLTISSLLGYATEQWVGDNYLPSANFTKANIKSTLGISDWALATTKPSYTADEVGAYIGNGNTIPGGEDLANLQAGSYWVYENLGAANAVKLSYSSLVVLGNSYYSPQMNISNNAQQAYIRGVYNIGSGNSVSDWHELAFTDSNVASATKLQTTRTIWGQSFDGSGNVDGALYMGGATMLHTDDSDTWLNYGGANDGKSLRLCGKEVIFQYGRGDAFTRAMTITDVGNIAVGGTTADAKLHVYGDTIVDGSLETSKIYIEDASTPLTRFVIAGSLRATVGYETNFGAILQSYVGGHYFLLKDDTTAYISCNTTINGDLITTGAITATKIYAASSTATSLIEIKVNGNTSVATFGYENGYGAIIQSYKGGNYFLLKDDNTAFLSCSTTINGNLLVNGNVSWVSQSQRSLKHITSEQGLSLAQLERIKPIKFYWKDRRDAVLHVGGVADVFDEVLPEVVARNKGVLCLNYVDAAFYVGASLIAPVLDHERRITEGEREREALKTENVTLKRELAIMKQMLNQLPA